MADELKSLKEAYSRAISKQDKGTPKGNSKGGAGKGSGKGVKNCPRMPPGLVGGNPSTAQKRGADDDQRKCYSWNLGQNQSAECRTCLGGRRCLKGLHFCTNSLRRDESHPFHACAKKGGA